MANKMNINFFGKDSYYHEHSEDILKIVNEVYSHGKVVMGPEVAGFEKKIAKYCDRKYAIAVGSCTDALYFSLLGAKINPGDEILVTGFSFIASASCILMAEATPVFVDINPNTYMMDMGDLEKKITSKTKAIIAVNLFGDALDFETAEAIGTKYNVPIIEDAAQSIGGRYGNRKVGTLGLGSCISFDPTKLLSAQSNGGVVLTDDLEFYSYISKIRYHGKDLNTGEFDTLGFNSRLSSLQAALLSYNLDKLDMWIERNQKIARRYIEGISTNPNIKLPKKREESRHVFHKFVMQLEQRDKLSEWLKGNGIQNMVHYGKSLPENKLFLPYEYKAEQLNNIDLVKTKVLSLPIHPWLQDDEVDYIIDKVLAFNK